MNDIETIKVPASRVVRRRKTIKLPEHIELIPNTPYINWEKLHRGSLDVLKNMIDELWTEENLDLVNSGKIGNIKDEIRLPLAEIPYYTRNECLNGTIAPNGSIINSFYNREPFLEHTITKVSKIAYLIRCLYGISDFNFLPVSLISNPKDNSNMGVQMKNVLLGKDRGHFLTVFKEVVTEEAKFDKEFWKSVKSKLQQLTNKGYATIDSLTNFQTHGMDEIISKLSEVKSTFSLKDILDDFYYNRIYTQKETIQIRLETIDTHRSEIESINNGENDWKTHNYALTRLTDRLVDNLYLDYNQLKIDEMCAKSEVLMGEHPFLKGRRNSNFSGFETEPLMILAATINDSFDRHLYEKLSGISDIPKRAKSYIECIVTSKKENRYTTEKFKNLLKELEIVANITADDGVTNLWGSWNDNILNAYDVWKTTYIDKKTTNKFDTFRVSSMDMALIMYRAIKYIMKECKVRESGLSATTKQFIEWFIDETKNNSYEFVKAVETAENSWKGKFEKVIGPYTERFIKYKIESAGEVKSEHVLKKEKLRALRTKAVDIGLPTKFTMYDRNNQGWFVTDIDLNNGNGLNLCHYTSATKAGMYTSENTDMGPARDNIDVVKEKIIPTDYFSPDGKFIKDFKKEVNQPTDIDLLEPWMNTVKFSKFYKKD